jgi:hypothetical protein
MESRFKKDDRVYHWAYWWATVVKVDENNYVHIAYDSLKGSANYNIGVYNVIDPYDADVLLSFTEYNFYSGGFSKDRKPEPKYGDLIWVRFKFQKEWTIKRFEKFRIGYESSVVCLDGSNWEEYSITNPYDPNLDIFKQTT